MDKKIALQVVKAVLGIVVPCVKGTKNLAEEIVDFEWHWDIRMTKQKTGHPPKTK